MCSQNSCVSSFRKNFAEHVSILASFMNLCEDGSGSCFVSRCPFPCVAVSLGSYASFIGNAHSAGICSLAVFLHLMVSVSSIMTNAKGICSSFLC